MEEEGRREVKTFFKDSSYRFGICRGKEVILLERMVFWLGREFTNSNIEICV